MVSSFAGMIILSHTRESARNRRCSCNKALLIYYFAQVRSTVKVLTIEQANPRCEFIPLVESRQIKDDSWKHGRFENAEKKSDGENL
jgi:hypothetical protein